MRKFWSLLKLQLDARYGISYARYTFRNDKKALWKGIGIAIAILLALVEVLGLYTFLIIQVHKAAQSLYTPQMVLTMASVGAGVIVLIFGIFYIISTLFLAKDTEFLSSLPLPQGSVFASKFMLVLIGEYPFAFCLMLPPVIVYGIGAHKGPLYYLMAIVCTLLIPLVPLILSAVFSMILMNIVSRSRRRDLITTIGSILLLILFICGQFYLTSRIPENDKDFLKGLMQSSNALVEFTGRAFPPAVWVTKTLSSPAPEAIVNFLYLALSSLGAFALVYFLASFIYQRGATAQLETQAKSGKVKLNYQASSHLMTIFKNEWRILIRTPIYALNSLVMVFMAPLLMLIPLFGGNLSKDPDIQFLFRMIKSGEAQPYLVLIMAAVIMFFTLINPAISSTFSREGRNFWILKNIPIKPEIQVYGKLLAGYSISFVASVLAAIAAMLSFKVSLSITLMVIVLCALGLIPISVVNIYIDLRKPKLEWNNAQEAIKQNANVIVGMLLGFLIMAVYGVIAYLITTLNLNVYAIFGIMAVVLLLLSDVSMHLLHKVAKKGYQHLEI